MVTCCIDLMEESAEIPKVDLIVANLLVEYIGIQKLIIHVRKFLPKYLSLVLQQNEQEDAFISHSPYLDKLTSLSTIFPPINKEKLSYQLSFSDYECCMQEKYNLPNDKSFIRLDYCKK